MKRNILLIVGILVLFLLVFNSGKRLLLLRTNSQKVLSSEMRLEELKKENEALKFELEYKKTNEFAEEEIRNKLGLAKEGETVVILPKDQTIESTSNNSGSDLANWEKWRDLFFGS